MSKLFHHYYNTTIQPRREEIEMINFGILIHNQLKFKTDHKNRNHSRCEKDINLSLSDILNEPK